MTLAADDQINEEYMLYMVRHMQFLNIWTLYKDFLSGRYVPSVPGYEGSDADWRTPAGFQYTLMFLLYSFFYSLVDQDSRGTNAFRIWRARFPSEEEAIAAVEYRINPVVADLKTFRHRLGFHGSTSLKHQNPGFDLFGTHSGTKMLNLMKQYKSLNSWLAEMQMATQAAEGDRIKAARAAIDRITVRCEPNSSADFDNTDLEPIGI